METWRNERLHVSTPPSLQVSTSPRLHTSTPPMSSPLDISELRAAFEIAIESARTPTDLKAVRDKFLSRKHGTVTLLVKAIAQAPVELRPTLGATANALKQEIERAL